MNNDNTYIEKNKEKIIELEQLASEVLKLKKLHRQRRPIVIEFCGSPKAGKTSCINSLNLFLKRNGFKTSVLSERASVSPISDKHNPIFNVWTCTSAINEINEKMDRARNGEDIDIIISDRGIFDALCWFRWLKTQHNMSEYEYNVLTKFATIYRWQKNIDLVYVFMVSPQESIEREYANLLTTKRGSIMRENVLEQYLKSVKDTIDEYRSEFRATHQIDTTDKEQNDVGYEVTLSTLEVLKDMLIEKIGYIPKSEITLREGINDFETIKSSLDSYSFANRDEVESNEQFIQPIPIAVITNLERNKILCIKKTKQSTSKYSPESGKLLLYAGGHMRQEDETNNKKNNFVSTAKNTLERELLEEIGISYCIDNYQPFVLYTPSYGVKSSQHLAIGWIIELDEKKKLNLDRYEIIQKRGTSKSGNFISFIELEQMFLEKRDLLFESWSKEILLSFFKDKCSEYFINQLITNKSNPQMSLFNNTL